MDISKDKAKDGIYEIKTLEYYISVKFKEDYIEINCICKKNESYDLSLTYFYFNEPIAEFDSVDEVIQEEATRKLSTALDLNTTEVFEEELIKKIINLVVRG